MSVLPLVTEAVRHVQSRSPLRPSVGLVLGSGLGAFAHDFMAIKVWGDINVGIIVGLGQFVSTFIITAIYVRFANRELDPRAEAIRNQLEGGAA